MSVHFYNAFDRTEYICFEYIGQLVWISKNNPTFFKPMLKENTIENYIRIRLKNLNNIIICSVTYCNTVYMFGKLC